MQQLFERRYRSAEQGLHVRIGLGAGESTVKDGDYFGMPSIEAARLCAQAPSDGILISGLAKTLAGRCEGIEFASAGELELKGFPEPVQAFAVSWAPIAEEASGCEPLAVAGAAALGAAGRLRRTCRGARCDRGGAGARARRRSARWCCSRANRGSARRDSRATRRTARTPRASRCCWGACSEELAVPYEPWIEVCSQLVEHAPQELLERHSSARRRAQPARAQPGRARGGAAIAADL